MDIPYVLATPLTLWRLPLFLADLYRLDALSASGSGSDNKDDSLLSVAALQRAFLSTDFAPESIESSMQVNGS